MNRSLCLAGTVACLGVLVLNTFAYFGAKFVMDDGLMFVRYARNILEAGTVAWNLADGPAYGATSLGFLALVTALQTLWPDETYWGPQVASCAGGVVFLALMAWMIVRETDRALRPYVLLVIAACLAGAASFLAAQFMTGMDTTMAMSTTCLLLILWRGGDGLAPSWLTGVLGGLAVLVRPDLILIALGVPGIVWLTGGASARFFRGCLAATLGTVAVLLFVLDSTLGTPVPLPTFAKLLADYGSDFTVVYRHVPIVQMINLGGAYWMLITIAAIGIVAFKTDLRSPEHRLVLAVAVVTVLWAVYLLAVTQIMAYRGRFYHPVLPFVIFLAVWGIGRAKADWSGGLGEAPDRLRTAAIVLLTASCVPAGLAAVDEVRFHLREGYIGEFDAEKTWEMFWADMWYRLPEVVDVDSALVMASTEVGLPGVMLPEGTLIDLAGLNDVTIATQGFDAERLLGDRQPDILYMPHPHYVSMIDAIVSAEAFAGYERFPGALLGTDLDVAIRRDSPHYEALRELMPVDADFGNDDER